MTVKAIFFDLDDTLVDDTTSYPLSIQRLCQEFSPVFDHKRLRAAYDITSPAFWAAGDLMTIRESLWRQALAACGYDVSLAAAVRDSYLRHRVETTQVLPGVKDVLDVLAGRYRLGVITNGGGDIQTKRLEYLGLDRYFEIVIASTDVNSGKPDPQIFRHALQRLSVEAAAAWHVGDMLASDVLGALNSGLTAVWFNALGVSQTADDPQPHHEIVSLAELPELLSS